jgi:hypothetical protein
VPLLPLRQGIEPQVLRRLEDKINDLQLSAGKSAEEKLNA